MVGVIGFNDYKIGLIASTTLKHDMGELIRQIQDEAMCLRTYGASLVVLMGEMMVMMIMMMMVMMMMILKEDDDYLNGTDDIYVVFVILFDDDSDDDDDDDDSDDSDNYDDYDDNDALYTQGGGDQIRDVRLTLFIQRSLRQSLYKYVDIILTHRVLIDNGHVKNNKSHVNHMESISGNNDSSSDRSNYIDSALSDMYDDHHDEEQDIDHEYGRSAIQDCHNQWYVRHNNPLVPMGFISPGHTNQMGFLSIMKNHHGISIRNDLLPI